MEVGTEAAGSLGNIHGPQFASPGIDILKEIPVNLPEVGEIETGGRGIGCKLDLPWVKIEFGCE